MLSINITTFRISQRSSVTVRFGRKEDYLEHKDPLEDDSDGQQHLADSITHLPTQAHGHLINNVALPPPPSNIAGLISYINTVAVMK